MQARVAGLILSTALVLAFACQAGESGDGVTHPTKTPDVRILERTLGLSGHPPMRVSRAGFHLAADEGCTQALPYACNGANMCCDSPSIYYCENYQGPIKEMRGRSGCIKAGASDEAVKDFSQSCTRFISC